MKKYILYSCDNWHSYESFNIRALCSSLDVAVSLSNKIATDEGFPLSDWDLDFISNKHQTQGYEGEGEFIIEEYIEDKIY